MLPFPQLLGAQWAQKHKTLAASQAYPARPTHPHPPRAEQLVVPWEHLSGCLERPTASSMPCRPVLILLKRQ